MFILKVKKIIYKTLENFISPYSSTELKDVFQELDIKHLKDSLYINLPKYTSDVVEEVYNTLFEYLPLEREELEILINSNIKELMYLLIVKDNKVNNKDLESLLIFYLLLRYKLKYNTPLEDSLLDLKGYFLSFIISNQDQLIGEVEMNPTEAITKVINDYYVRVSKDNLRLIPTQKTFKTFNKYLY